MIPSLLDIIQVMSEKIDNGDDWNGEPKKTRKNKPKVPSVVGRTTRRAKRKDSSDECTLPEIIPRNQFPQMVLSQSFESEITRLVLQVPLSFFVGEKKQQFETTRVENIPLQVRLTRENDNICCGLRLPEDVIMGQGIEFGVILHGKYSWLSDNSPTTKHIKSVRKVLSRQNWEETSWLKLSPVHSDLFVTLAIRKEEDLCEDYLGLVNQGNTCYMNSYLQMLFHLPAFRKLIFAAQITEPDRFPATLQMLFYKMMEDERAVSPEELIKSFGWSKKDAKVQQDVQEFSCLFFDVLERKVEVFKPPGDFGNIPQLFCGELTHYIQCCHVGIVSADFRTQNQERFYDLHVPLAPTIAQSLDDFVGEQVLDEDNRYQTDYYGLQEARKGLIISKLPPVLMLQLKRFQYNYFTDSNEKILTECKYPEQMDFSKWTSDPQIPSPYLLYGVLVHEGSFANSGHYYVYIKTPQGWLKFNDERVEKVTRERVLHHNYGGQSQIVEYDSKEMKVTFKSVQNKATAYMLVYANKHIYNSLFQELKPNFPEWLIKRTQYRQEMEEEKKVRKQSICGIPVLRWSKHFIGHSTDGIGFAPRDICQSSEERIEMIPKSQKVSDWLEGKQVDEVDKEIYMMWTVQDREAVMGINNKSTLSMKQLFNQIPDPYFFFAPLAASKEQFLVIIKLFHKEDGELYYQGLTKIVKDAQVADLHTLLKSIFPGDSLFYLQDRKQGVIPVVPTDNSMLPPPSPARNQLLIVVVEEIREGEEAQQVLKLYKQELDTLQTFFKNEGSKDYSWERWINKFVTVEEIRKIIFDEIVTEKDDYQSPSNIVVRYRAKKNSKILSEANDADKLKDITKHDRVLQFSFSTLSIDQRLTQKQLIFFYRHPLTLKLSEPQGIVVHKNSKESLFDMIISSDVLKTQLPLSKGQDYRLFLLSKDRTYINDIVSRNGSVSGKGELAQVLEKEKHSALVVESYEVCQGEDKMINILVHHVAKTGQKIGIPRWECVPAGCLLSALKVLILDSISKEHVEFQGKTHLVNPMKVRILAYIKEWSRAEELPQSSQFEDIKPDSPQATIQSRFGTPRYLRVGVVHNQISKTIQALKLNVE